MAGPPRALSEYDAKKMLARYGVPVSTERLAADPEAAVAAAESIGYPVVAKLCGAQILHKTELGAVRLGLGDAPAVRQAARELLAGAPRDPDVGVLVAETVRGKRELIAGVAQDPHFGTTIMMGIGGIFTEALADVVFRLLPASRTELASMADDLATQALLGAFRSEPPVDRNALTDTLAALAACAEAEPDIESIDLNPLIVAGDRPIAVDALVVLR